MKKQLLTFTLCLTGVNLCAQVDRSKIPAPGPAPEIKVAEPQTFQLKNGLKVFVVENHKLPRVSFTLTIDSDPIIEGKKAGYAQIAGEMLRRGTTKRSKDELDEAIDFIGASLSTSSTGIYAASLKKHVDELLELTADILLNPAFLQQELEKIRTQTLSGLAAAKDDPDAIAANLQNVLLYGKDHPYGELTTEQTVEYITLEDCKKYYKTYFKPNISYLAIVGDITEKEAQKLVKKYFSQWKKGDVPKVQYSIPQPPEKVQVAIVDRPNAVQSVIKILYPIALNPSSPDVIKSDLMNKILGGGFSGRLFANLRETHAYTYGAYSSLSSDKLVGSFSANASVRNAVTDSAVTQFFVELNRIRDTKVTAIELERMQNYTTGSFARQLENPATVARFALNIERYGLPKDYYKSYLKKVAAINIDDIHAIANKYILPKNAYILAVGKADEIAEKLTGFGKLTYYDIYGEEYTPSKDIPTDLTAQKVIANYISAIGGQENIEKIKDLKISMKALFGPQEEIIIDLIQKAPNYSLTTISVSGNAMGKEVFDGKNITKYEMGNKLPSNEGERKDAAVESYIVPELSFDQTGVDVALIGKERIEGQDAYAVSVTLPSGKQKMYYYDTKTNLKVRETETVQIPGGEMVMVKDLLSYIEKAGVKFPSVVMIPLGPQKAKAELVNIEVNTGVGDSAFATE